MVKAQSESESFWLAFVVMLHVGSALGLLAYYWRDWVEIVSAFFATLRKRRAETANERVAWLIIAASIPTGLLGAEFFRRRAAVRELAVHEGAKADGGRRLDTLEYREAGVIGVAQSTALLAGISRDGVCMAAGLARGMDHSDSARFAFLLATPIILAAGLFKLPDLTGPLGEGVRGQAAVACLSAAIAAFFTVRFLVKYFQTRTLTPFAISATQATHRSSRWRPPSISERAQDADRWRRPHSRRHRSSANHPMIARGPSRGAGRRGAGAGGLSALSRQAPSGRACSGAPGRRGCPSRRSCRPGPSGP